MGTRKSVKHVVATKGDLAMVAAGQELFVKAGKRLSYNVLPGQLVAYTDNKDGTTTTVDSSTLTAANIAKLYLGVGVDSNGDGSVDTIQHVGTETLAGCQVERASASSPRCGNPVVKDFLFDCTNCDETYSVAVDYDDNWTRDYAPWNATWARTTASYTTECAQCDDCPADHQCAEIAEALADRLNGELDLKLNEDPYPDWKNPHLPRPFKVTKLHSRSLVYCLNPTTPSGDCETCNSFDGIKSATIDGATVTFTGNLDPGDNTATLRAQLQNIVDQINEAFDDVAPYTGFAYLTGDAQSPCCPLQLHVNTGDATFALQDTADADLAPTETDPFANETLTCGIRVISESMKGDCSCYIEKPLNFYGRRVRVLPYGDGWKTSQWKTKEIQKMELPANFGSWIQWKQYDQDLGGRGRAFRKSNINRGWLNIPDDTSRVQIVTADCAKDYCGYHLAFSQTKQSGVWNAWDTYKVASDVYIPSDDSTTIADWETFINALLALVPGCEGLPSLACSPVNADCA